MDEWFKDWFDTEEYLFVYRERNEKEAVKLVNLIIKNIKLNPGGAVLDLACGTGRHSILFAEKGFKVTAIDLSRNLLAIARSAAEEAKVRINFIRTDIRNFNIAGKFNLAINLFTSFGYFKSDTENFKVIQNAFEHLAVDGYFVIDYLNCRYIEKNLVPQSETDYHDGQIIQKRKIEGDRVIKQIFIRRDGTEKQYHESVRMYSKDELSDILDKTGFKITNLFGDYNGNTFDLETSPRIIIIAQK